MSNAVVFRAKDLKKKKKEESSNFKRQKKEEAEEEEENTRSCDGSSFLWVRLTQIQSFKIAVFSIFTSTSSALKLQETKERRSRRRRREHWDDELWNEKWWQLPITDGVVFLLLVFLQRQQKDMIWCLKYD